MIAHGMICHPDDSFSLPLGERSASMATGLYPRTLMKWAAYLVNAGLARFSERPPVRPAASAFRQTNWAPLAAMGYLHADHHLRQFGVQDWKAWTPRVC
jgi:hypothetical protein